MDVVLFVWWGWDVALGDVRLPLDFLEQKSQRSAAMSINVVAKRPISQMIERQGTQPNT
jgi:hypothetical protein